MGQLTASVALALSVSGPPASAGRVVPPGNTRPLIFESNQGQYPAPAQFVARGAAYCLTLSPTELRVTLQRVLPTAANQTAADAITPRSEVRVEYRALAIELIGANPSARLIGDEMAALRANYFLGNDPAGWRVNVPAYQRLRATDIYPGINLVHYGNQQELEYDFEVAPGVDANQIALRFVGADRMRIDATTGELILTLGDQEVRQPKPVIYQTIRGQRKFIAGNYVLQAPDTIRFALGDYDARLPLVIDPVVSYSKLFGGSSYDTFWAMAVDNSGSIYLAGETLLPGLATLGAFQTNYGGTYAGTYRSWGDVVVAKFNNQLTATNYITYLGGIAAEAAIAIAVDGAGNAYVAGYTDSTNFPTRFPIQASIAGVTPTKRVPSNEAFVAKLDPSGSNLLFSTFYGGTLSEVAYGIALDASTNIYVVGQTYSTNLPILNTSFTTSSGGTDGFVLKLDATGSNAVYAMYLGGAGNEHARDVVVNPAGNPLITGYTTSTNFPVTTNALQRFLNQSTNITTSEDVFVVELSPASGTINYGTFLGGTNVDQAIRIATDASGAVYVTGLTQSGDYYRTSTNFYTVVVSNSIYSDAFVTKLSPSYTNLDYSMTFGGSVNDFAWDIAVDAAGRAAVIGQTASTDYPTNGLTSILRGTNSGGTDAFIAQLNATGDAFLYSAYLGGLAEDVGYGVAVDTAGNAYYSGRTSSSNFPLQPSATVSFSDRAGFVVKILPDDLSALNISLVGANVLLSWSALLPGLTVQATTNPALANAWVDLNVTPVVTNGQTTVLVPSTNAAQFFRLKP